MAVRRMFCKNVIDSDAFLELPPSAQNLYFHLNMRADDDGFVNNPKMVTRIVGSGEEDLRRLEEKGYLLSFGSGVVAITHWRVHNQIRKDRYTPTQYQEEFLTLAVSLSGVYSACDGPAEGDRPVYRGGMSPDPPPRAADFL